MLPSFLVSAQFSRSTFKFLELVPGFPGESPSRRVMIRLVKIARRRRPVGALSPLVRGNLVAQSGSGTQSLFGEFSPTRQMLTYKYTLNLRHTQTHLAMVEKRITSSTIEHELSVGLQYLPQLQNDQQMMLPNYIQDT